MRYLFISIALLTSVFCYTANAKHDEDHKVKNMEARIAVVDIVTVFERSIALQAVRDNIKNITQDIQQEMSKRELELKEMENNLVKQRETVSLEEFDKKAAEFNTLVSQNQLLMREKKNKLDQMHSDSMNKIHESVMHIIENLAKKYGFNLVLPSSQVLFAASQLDITYEVIQILNTKIRTLE